MAGELDTLAINTIRVVAADIVQKANSGHPGAPMGCAPMAHLLWGTFMNYNPRDPKWLNRDRFVLSNGHACALQYLMLNLSGYDVPMSELQRFRQIGSITPGHPEAGITPGVEVSTGPLGQGISNAVGMALAESHLAAVYNKPDFTLFDNFTYVICGDGCLQEGVSSEACSIAGHLQLGHLIVLYDDNHITIDGDTNLSFTEDVLKRYEAYGWHVQAVAEGDTNLVGLKSAIEAAQKDPRPSIIKVRTIIGYGSGQQGHHKIHGSPLGAADIAETKKRMGFNPDQSFFVPDDVRAFYGRRAAAGAERQQAWNELRAKYARAYSKEAADLARREAGELPADLLSKLPKYGADAKPLATRQLGELTLNALAGDVTDLVGGSADLNPSTLTYIKASGDYQSGTPAGRNIRFGVREHGMAAICNGMAAYGAIRPYCSTFLNFIEYCFPSVRLSALSHFPVIYVMTHDSIGLGEDGPTHQPIEAIPLMRATPHLNVWRPADGNEVNAAYVSALRQHKIPSVLCLSRQAMPHIAASSLDDALRGAYVAVKETAALQIVLVGTGSEVSVAVEAAKAFGAGARVVSMPCREEFLRQDKAYRDSVLPVGIASLAVEAAATSGWTDVVHYAHGINRFGASAPAPDVFKDCKLTAGDVVETAKKLVARFPAGSAPVLGPL
eukprot:TRINITY_DN5723_c0_g1_i1.p1 TRINITY_DN5723_c0_g1~~TRINITY_DN5723_c0_g1_i1.p1  ORF type:complete len:703 (-),score=174.87 TRINITY_DN5723_c0_g1_i1:571-2577(-)